MAVWLLSHSPTPVSMCAECQPAERCAQIHRARTSLSFAKHVYLWTQGMHKISLHANTCAADMDGSISRKKVMQRAERRERKIADGGTWSHFSHQHASHANSGTTGVAGTILISKLTESDKVLSLFLAVCARCSRPLHRWGEKRPTRESAYKLSGGLELSPNHRPFFYTFACCPREEHSVARLRTF